MFILNLFFHYQNTKNSIGVDLPLWGGFAFLALAGDIERLLKISEEEEAMVPFLENST